MTSPAFARLQPGYAKLWASIEPKLEHLASIKADCRRLIASKSTYREVEKATGVPWWWVAITDQMEGGGGADTYLGNGQSLSRKTTEVPIGDGPFANFVAGAVYAIHRDGIQKLSIKTAEEAAYAWEDWNGWGYLHLDMEDPYLAAWSNKESPGKYVADHQFDPTAMSKQPGALTILKILISIDATILATTQQLPGQPKEPTVSTMPNIDFATLEKIVEQGLPFVSRLYPPLAKFQAPITTLAKDLLHAVPGTDKHSMLSVFVADGLPILGMAIPEINPFMPLITIGANLLLNAIPPQAAPATAAAT